jgi:hypothetical protein
MKRALATLALVAFIVPSALAAPGEPRILQGILEWPPTLSAEPFIVVRGEGGRAYYVDVSAAQRRVPGPVTAGSRVAVLGVEGSRPFEVAGIAFGAGDAAALGLTPPAPGPVPPAAIATAPAAPAPASPAEPMWRLDGVVHSVAGGTVSLRADDGQTHSVDATPLSPITLRQLRTGDRLSLFGEPRADGRLIATGLVQTDPAAPAASPPTTR